METFLTFAKSYIFSPEHKLCFVCFCLIIIIIDLQILGHNLLLEFYLHILMFHSKNTNDAKKNFDFHQIYLVFSYSLKTEQKWFSIDQITVS